MSNAHAIHNPLLPHIATVTMVKDESLDFKTYQVVFDEPGVLESFGNKPGQCGMFSILGVGEAMISITSSPTRKGMLEFSIKKVGRLTKVIHDLQVGDKIALRGPYGRPFPYEEMKGKNCLFVAGGIGLAPLRSLIDYVLDNRDNYGKVDIIYGARTYADICFKDDLWERWPNIRDTKVYTTIDRAEEAWTGRVGHVPGYLEEIAPSPDNTVAVTCGPPIMIKFALKSLEKLGFKDEQVITTLEMKMKCGIGKCGRCNIGEKFICVDGPVFTAVDLRSLPPEW